MIDEFPKNNDHDKDLGELEKFDTYDEKWEYSTHNVELRIHPRVYFVIRMNPEFVRYAYSIKPTKKSVDELFARAKEEIGTENTLPNMYTFIDGTASISAIYSDVGGKWMNTDPNSIKRYSIDITNTTAIQFDPHNIDTVAEAIRVQILFDTWVRWVLYGKHEQT